jgi:hypothetical protein
MTALRSLVVFLCLVAIAVTGTSIVEAADGPRAGKDGPPITDRFPFPVREVSLERPDSVALPSRPQPSKTTATLLSDGFEGSFPGANWDVSINSGSADAAWGRSTRRASAGSASIWCAAAGSQSPSPGGDVPNNMSAWVITGPYDLSAATSGTLQFDVWLETEADYDQFYWMFSTNGTNFNGYVTSVSTQGFQTIPQDLGDWGNAGSSLGLSQVWFAFLYKTDVSNTFEGAYIDQVSLTASGGGGGSNCGTYVLTQDNEGSGTSGVPDGDWGYCLYNNDPKHPIEFRFDINEVNVNSAQLLLLANDVDQLTEPANPEQDKVYMNGTYLGDLTGANNEDSTTVFTVPPSSLLIGSNWVTIEVNQHPSSVNNPDKWCVELKQAQLIINGGCTGQATCRSVTTNKNSYSPGENVQVTYEVDTSAGSQQVRVESNLVNPSGQIIAGVDSVYTTNGSANDPKSVNLALPAGAVAGTYKAQVLVFDNATGQLESSCEDTFTVTGGGGNCSVTCSASVPATARVGVPVQFTASSNTSGCSGSPEYFWYPDTSTTATIFQQNPTVTYDQPGTYNWSMSVVVDNETCMRSGTITVTGGGGGCNLTCSATVPTTATINQPVQHRATANASGCSEPVAYFWWPDTRTTATVMDQNFTGSFDQPGTYNWQMVAVADNERCERTGSTTVGSTGASGAVDVWIPVGSRANGANNSTWRTDIAIFNPSSVVVTVQVIIYTTSGPVSQVVSINPFGQFVQTDVVGWLVPGGSLSGAIQIIATQAISVTTRTYNQFAAGVICFPTGTLGQALGPLPATAAIQTGQFGWIPNLTQNAGFRSNIGFTNTSTANAVVRVDLYNANGVKIGTFNRTLQPGQWWQSNEPFRTVAGVNNIRGGSAQVTVTSGKGVIVYGSVVDNITNDPTTVTMVR